MVDRMPILKPLDTCGRRLSVLVESATGEVSDPKLWPSIGEYPCYDDYLYQTMTTDEVRNVRFRNALRRSVAGKVVLDIGTGKDLIWARESIRCGARHVVAMEAMSESYRQAAQTLRALNLDRKITLLEGASTSIESDLKADVCVAEIIGSVAGAEGAAAVIGDTRRRHLVPGGIVIPDRAVTLAAAVCLADVLGGRQPAFAEESIRYLKVICDWNGAPFDVRLRIKNPVTSAIMSNSEPVEVLDFNGDLRQHQERRVSLTMTRAGRVDGVLAWLALSVVRDEFPLDALDEKTNWASVYFPLFDPGVDVEEGDILELTFRTTPSDNGVNPDYQLTAKLRTERHGDMAARHNSLYHGRLAGGCSLYRNLFPGGDRPALAR
jgi:protein arginine N-methyltransferase 1